MVVLLFCQNDALLEEIDGRIADERTIELIQMKGLFIFLPATGLFKGMPGCRNLRLTLGHIVG